ncbi:hypothetical protein [Pseudonocardia sp. NPDC046786]|uniref:hypothetical protein n=1 Tax=Pseudonocardia sp. NPDC046786 TaxID=3155471 RepID=UPI003408C115
MQLLVLSAVLGPGVLYLARPGARPPQQAMAVRLVSMVLPAAVTAGDDPTAAAPTFAARLTCPSRYVEFGPADGVTGHCETTGRAVFHREVFDWPDEVLA